MLNSQVIMSRLTHKYKDAARDLCKLRNHQRQITTNEILMLLKTPIYRLLLEKSFSNLLGKELPYYLNFEPLNLLDVDCDSLLQAPLHSDNNLISPAPFITSLFEPISVTDTNINYSNSIFTDMFYSFDLFSDVSSKLNLKLPSDTDREILKKSILQLGRIALEPIEDIAFNIRFICLLSFSNSKQESSQGVSFTSPFVPGIIFIGGNIISEPIKLIESIYHESLHVKWINTFHAYNLIRFEFLNRAKHFYCPWAKDSQAHQWPFMRAAAAYHVYCHLLALHQLILKKGEFYQNWSAERILSICEKFETLKIYIEQSEDVLTQQGKEYFILLYRISQMT